ncbi:MAG: RDD family protein [Candidatus Acidiferrales bacterium]
MSQPPIAPAPTPGDFAEKLTIETPEQTPLEFEIAGIGSRFLAIAIDTLIQTAAAVIVGLAGALIFISLLRTREPSTIWLAAILIVFAFVLFYGYFAIFEAIWNGQTPGKRSVGIRVIKDSGRPITPAESVARNLLRIVDQLPTLYATGVVSMLLSKQNKRLGDFVAGTIVVRENSLEKARPVWQAAPVVANITYGSERLGAEEFALIEAFLNRRNQLEPYVRYQMAAQIAAKIQPKLTIPQSELPSPEKLLEAIAYERRATGRYF